MLQGTLPPRSNKANWGETIELYDDDTNAAMDLSTAEDIIVSVRDECSTVLSAKLSGGTVTLADDGLSASFNFTAGQMGGLCPKTYEFGIRIIFVDQDNELQLFLGYVPVLRGL